MALGGKGKGKSRVPKTVRHQRNANAWDHWKVAVNNPELMRGLVIRDRNSTIKDNSSTSYIGMVRRLTSVIYNVYPELIETDATGAAIMHEGKASGVYILRVPIDEEKIKTVFTMLRRDPSFTKPKSLREKRNKAHAKVAMNDDDDSYRDSDDDHSDCSSGSYSDSDEFEFQEEDYNTGTMNPQTFKITFLL